MDNQVWIPKPSSSMQEHPRSRKPKAMNGSKCKPGVCKRGSFRTIRISNHTTAYMINDWTPIGHSLPEENVKHKSSTPLFGRVYASFQDCTKHYTLENQSGSRKWHYIAGLPSNMAFVSFFLSLPEGIANVELDYTGRDCLDSCYEYSS